MANSDDRQRDMPLPDDRLSGRGEVLAYPEAVLLVDPVESRFKGQVSGIIFRSQINPTNTNEVYLFDFNRINIHDLNERVFLFVFVHLKIKI